MRTWSTSPATHPFVCGSAEPVGDLTTDPTVIKNVTIVFKEGVGYDSPAMLDAIKGQVNNGYIHHNGRFVAKIMDKSITTGLRDRRRTCKTSGKSDLSVKYYFSRHKAAK